VDRELRRAVRSGKVIIGSDKTIKAVKLGNAKLVVLASNYPRDLREKIERYGKLAGVSVYTYPKDNVALGLACGKPFPVSALSVVDPGDSSILRLGESK